MTSPSKRNRSSASSGDDDNVLPLQKKRGIPLHQQLHLILRNRILSGLYRPGDFLPGEEELAHTYGLSRATVRSALASLEEAGLIERRPGIGTRVKEVAASPQPHPGDGQYFTHIANVGRYTTAKVIEFGYQKAPLRVREFFDCDPDALFQRAVRVRSAGGLPLFYITTYLPEALGQAFTREDLEHSSLIDLLQRAGARLNTARQIVSAVLADPIIASHLNIDVGDPLLYIRRIYYDKAGKPFEYIEFLTSPQSFELHTTLGAGEEEQ